MSTYLLIGRRCSFKAHTLLPRISHTDVNTHHLCLHSLTLTLPCMRTHAHRTCVPASQHACRQDSNTTTLVDPRSFTDACRSLSERHVATTFMHCTSLCRYLYHQIHFPGMRIFACMHAHFSTPCMYTSHLTMSIPPAFNYLLVLFAVKTSRTLAHHFQVLAIFHRAQELTESTCLTTSPANL